MRKALRRNVSGSVSSHSVTGLMLGDWGNPGPFLGILLIQPFKNTCKRKLKNNFIGFKRKAWGVDC